MTRTALYCRDCMRFLAYDDQDGADVLTWVAKCDWCLGGKRPATPGKQVCLQCGSSFVPTADRRVFHSDSCRARWWREHRNGEEAA